MWIRHLFLGFTGLAAGSAVAAGTFAFIIVIGVVPRMIAKCNLAKYTVLFENMIVFGGIAGNLISVFTGLPLPLGRGLLMLFGLSAGIFVGCIAVALAEILNTFPILSQIRSKKACHGSCSLWHLGRVWDPMYYFLMHMAAE